MKALPILSILCIGLLFGSAYACPLHTQAEEPNQENVKR
jgi:hypothetical protein